MSKVKMRLAGSYGIIVGVLMLAQWAFFLAVGQVPELQTEPFRISLHLAAELVTALGLIVAGIALLRELPWGAAAYLFFAGMLVYSVIASPGYFAQQGQWGLVFMFVMLLVLALVSAFFISQSIESKQK